MFFFRILSYYNERQSGGNNSRFKNELKRLDRERKQRKEAAEERKTEREKRYQDIRNKYNLDQKPAYKRMSWAWPPSNISKIKWLLKVAAAPTGTIKLQFVKNSFSVTWFDGETFLYFLLLFRGTWTWTPPLQCHQHCLYLCRNVSNNHLNLSFTLTDLSLELWQRKKLFYHDMKKKIIQLVGSSWIRVSCSGTFSWICLHVTQVIWSTVICFFLCHKIHSQSWFPFASSFVLTKDGLKAQRNGKRCWIN